MSDTSGSPLVPSRDARLTPEAVAERGFSQSKRGYSETEVRAFLRLVADELASLTSHERDLSNRVRSLEERLAAPKPPPSDQDLIAALGEETARVLGQAREAAVELRTKADEHARRVVREAQESARELRATTQQAIETRTREAEDAARARANDILGEARTMRERVLRDLGERRQELERQVNDLRSGRGRLVEAYQVVERALAQAVRVMSEEPAGSAPMAAPGKPDQSAAPNEPMPEETDVPEPEPEPAPGDAATDVRDAAVRDVGALFEQLRSGQSDAQAEPESPKPAPADTDAEAAPEPAAGDEPEAGAQADADAAADAEADPSDGEAAEPTPVEQRDAALVPVADELGRRAKRALQDEQNDVLDGLRRQRGKIATEKILPSADEQLARWAHVLQPSLDKAYAAGMASTGAEAPKRGATTPAPLLGELASEAVSPLRTRLEESLGTVEARTPADLEIAIASALGARYREWRTQDLDTVLGDALAVAYARGVYDAAPDGARLRWVPAREGRCPDCDDNALEPTVKGEAFPTGQSAPPAHPGCRCTLVLEPAS